MLSHNGKFYGELVSEVVKKTIGLILITYLRTGNTRKKSH